MKDKIIDYVYSTKLGYFLALAILSVILDLLLLLFIPAIFNAAVIGSLCTAFLISITERNKRWF